MLFPNARAQCSTAVKEIQALLDLEFEYPLFDIVSD